VLKGNKEVEKKDAEEGKGEIKYKGQ
jgi:hypothetical protein